MVPGFGVPISDIQTDMRIENGYIYGTLKYCEDVTAVTGQPRELLDHGYNLILRYEQPSDAQFSGMSATVEYEGQTIYTPLTVMAYTAGSIPKDIVFHVSPLPDGASGSLPEGSVYPMKITFMYRRAGDTDTLSTVYHITSDTVTLEPQE